MSILGRRIKRSDNGELNASNILDYMAPQSISFSRDTMNLGPAHARTFTIFSFPTDVSIKWLETISRTQNAIVSYHVAKTDTSELLENIQRSINVENQKMYDSREEIQNQSASAHREQLMAVAKSLTVKKEEAVNLTVAVTIFDANPIILEKRCEDFVSTLQGQKFIARPMDLMQDEGFFNMMPLAQSQFHDMSGVDITLGTWTGSMGYLASQGLNDITGQFVGHDTTGEPIFMDIWERTNNRQNSNMSLVGVPGSGKSTFAKMMMLNQLSRGDKVIIIDAEREYTQIAEKIFGSVIEASGATDARINPLQLRDVPQSWDDYPRFDTQEEVDAYMTKHGVKNKGPLSAHITWLKEWFSTYIPEFDSEDISVLEDVLYETYNNMGIMENTDPRLRPNTEYPIMSDLYNSLLKSASTKKIRGEEVSDLKVASVNRIATLIKSTTTGTDRYLFNGHTTVDLSGSITVFDVHSLMEASENQKNAQFFNITTFCWLAITKNKKERVILIVDEAHLFISTKEAKVFQWLSTSSRRFRKYEGSLWLMTQNISDFYQESVREFGETLMNTPSNRIILQQGSSDLEKLKDWFGLSNGELRAVQQAGKGNGLFLIGEIRTFARIEPSRDVLKLIESAGSGR